jgi:hypothetical protein
MIDGMVGLMFDFVVHHHCSMKLTVFGEKSKNGEECGPVSPFETRAGFLHR